MPTNFTGFSNFAQTPNINADAQLATLNQLRKKIAGNYRIAEQDWVPKLLEGAVLQPEQKAEISKTCMALLQKLRSNPNVGHVQELLQEYNLNSSEGIALMCLAEALLRIPDAATRDDLIRDKVKLRDWASHIASDNSFYVNAASWGLLITGSLISKAEKPKLVDNIKNTLGKLGEPIIRKAIEFSIKTLGHQFVTGQTIEEALEFSSKREAVGFRYSFDMLGEAAMNAEDAEAYYVSYINAVNAIGKYSNGKGIYNGPGISIKLSALHPRYGRAKHERIMRELLPKVQEICRLCKEYNIGLNIDAEETERLEISLDIFQALAFDKALEGWNGLGFVVQAYQKRCPLVIDWLMELAHQSQKRLMVRLVKGAYWDSEIKQAQLDGQSGFPIYTRKYYTDISYVYCARKLLSARDIIFPQFATHNAQTLSTIYNLAGKDYEVGNYEFQCLHGMGESLYDNIVPADKFNRPCRVYAPVGNYETLLAYLVRRLLENGANSSFVNKINDENVDLAEIAKDPVDKLLAMEIPGLPHENVLLPKDIYSNRKNSSGLDLTDENTLAKLQADFIKTCDNKYVAGVQSANTKAADVINPSDKSDKIGVVYNNIEVDEFTETAKSAFDKWSKTDVEIRAKYLETAADLLEERMNDLIALIIREAGKSAKNAIGEIRESVDFLRFYSQEARAKLHNAKGLGTQALGTIVCISPWNFPLSIFMGQISAALAAGNCVLAKPAPETPLIAAIAVNILHEAGIPKDVLQLVTGGGEIGAKLVVSPIVSGVMFTGSSEVSRIIQKTLAGRTAANGKPIPLIAETGGQNAMIVDSSALSEQVVVDVITSAFDSAGQRCSALRILYLQEEIADKTLTMLKGAVEELKMGSPDRLDIDVGPLISQKAYDLINAHIETMSKNGKKVWQKAIDANTENGYFMPPSIIEINSIRELKREVFGPVLHIIRYKKSDLDKVINEINSSNYWLTFGLHTRIDDKIDYVISKVKVGNYYINRSIIGATVGVQPFGGHGLSGTGPKAGGPLYITHLVNGGYWDFEKSQSEYDASYQAFINWIGNDELKNYYAKSKSGLNIELEGPVGEKNQYILRPKGHIVLKAQTKTGISHILAMILASGNIAVVNSDCISKLGEIPHELATRIIINNDSLENIPNLEDVIIEGSDNDIINANKELAERDGKIVNIYAFNENDDEKTRLSLMDFLLEEASISTNTTAVGGNASLMAVV